MRPGRRSGRLRLLVAAVVGWIAVAAVPLAAQDTWVLLVTGLGGDPVYGERFLSWSGALRDAALASGVPAERVVWLGEDPAAAPGAIRSRSTLENVRVAVEEIAAGSAAGDRVLVVFVGHGTATGGEASFNLPRRDPTGADVAALLEPLADRTVAVVNTAPSSGPWVEALSAPGRVVVTATKTAGERNETRFGEHFAAAFTGDGADLDKDGRVSLLEAFTFARAEVERSYAQENLLVTEHAVLDDDGDGTGAEAPSAGGADAADGALAARFWLGGGSTGRTAADAPEGVPEGVTNPELRALHEERIRLERAVADLRVRQAEMEPDAYAARLEALLLELATTSRAIRAHPASGGGG